MSSQGATTGETGKHRMVKRPAAPMTTSAETADTPAVEPSHPSERSWLSGLWASGLQNVLVVSVRVPKPSHDLAGCRDWLSECNK